MYDATTMKLKNKNGPWEFSDETFSNFPQNSGDTSSVLTDEAKVLNAVSGKLVVFQSIYVLFIMFQVSTDKHSFLIMKIKFLDC